MQIVHATFRTGEGQEAVELLDTLGLDIEDYKLIESSTGDLLMINLLYGNTDVLIDNLTASFDFEDDEERSLIIFSPDTVIPRDERKLKEASFHATRESLVTYAQESSRLDLEYIILVLASAFITSLGLILDNIAVIVGSMVIAPVLGPILGITIGIVLGDNKLIRQGIFTEIVGTMIAIVVGFGIGIVIPNIEVTSSLDVRMSPTLADLLIAVAAGAASAYSLIKNQLDTGLVGVMVAAALVPVMSTIGIGISIGHQNMILGASLLLIGNFLGLLLSNMIVLYFEGIRPQIWYKFKAKKIIKKSLTFIILAIILFSIPLGMMTVYQFSEEKPVEIVANTIENQLQGKGKFEVMNIDISKDLITIYMLAEKEIQKEHLESIKNEIEVKLGNDFLMNFNIIPIEDLNI